MQLMLMGDYYAWYCDWCDSRNLTLWTRVEAEKVSCGCCHRVFAVGAQPAVDDYGKRSRMFKGNFQKVNNALY